MNETFSFTCRCCGTNYKEMPLCFGSEYPNHYFTVPPEVRNERIELTESLCVIDDHYFHRGRITIPIIDHVEDLLFDIWTTISKDNFLIRNDLWNDTNRILQPPYFGWLENNISTYGNTIHIKTIARENEIGYIPTIEIIEEHHQLLYDQLNGITFKEASEKVQQILAELHKNQ